MIAPRLVAVDPPTAAVAFELRALEAGGNAVLVDLRPARLVDEERALEYFLDGGVVPTAQVFLDDRLPRVLREAIILFLRRRRHDLGLVEPPFNAIAIPHARLDPELVPVALQAGEIDARGADRPEASTARVVLEVRFAIRRSPERTLPREPRSHGHHRRADSGQRDGG
jgi:hypothetical protein